MKKILPITVLIFNCYFSFGQLGTDDAGALMGLPVATNLIEINAILNPQEGSLVFNDQDKKIYRYTGVTDGWQAAGNQNADEVNTVASTSDLNGDGTVDASDIIDPDGDGVTEATSQAVFEAITPITSKAGRVFYPPSIEIDASTTGSKPDIDLYAEYTAQYGATIPVARRSIGAPDNIPIYQADELYYYVTYADPSVFTINSISALGVLSYEIIGIPSDYNTIINVVFVVK